MTQREKVLDLLERAGSEGVTNGQFADENILRYGARLKELREAGYDISTHGSGGTRTYVLEKREGGENPGSSLAEVAPVPTMTVRDLDGTWREVPTPAWALAGEDR